MDKPQRTDNCRELPFATDDLRYYDKQGNFGLLNFYKSL